MKKLISYASAFALAALLATPAIAADKKKADPNAERTIVGVGSCAKCNLGLTDTCQNAIKRTQKGKDGTSREVVYLLEQNDVSKAFHGTLCKGEKDVTAVGKVRREGKGKDAKMILVVSSIKEGKPAGKGKGKKKKSE